MSNEIKPFSQVPTTDKPAQIDFILLDGSASMIDKWWDSLDAIEAYVQGAKAGGVKSTIKITTFDSYNLAYKQIDQDIDTWTPLKDRPLSSYWGSTPLYDAINAMGRELASLDPAKASIVIVTDGQDTGSQTSIHQAKGILDWCRAKGWQVTFIGASFNNERQAGLLGADKSSAIGVSQQKLTDAASALAKKRAAYALYGTDMHWTDSEHQTFGGFLGNGNQDKDKS